MIGSTLSAFSGGNIGTTRATPISQLKTGAMPGGANRVRRLPAEIVQPALAR
jgi:hypothetical protein